MQVGVHRNVRGLERRPYGFPLSLEGCLGGNVWESVGVGVGMCWWSAPV